MRTQRELYGLLCRPVRHCHAQSEDSARVRSATGAEVAMLNVSNSIRSTKTVDGRILLDVQHGQMFSLNLVGSKILELLEQGWEEARIAEEISRAYATALDIARSDVHDFIEALRRNCIVQANGASDERF